MALSLSNLLYAQDTAVAAMAHLTLASHSLFAWTLLCSDTVLLFVCSSAKFPVPAPGRMANFSFQGE